MRESYPADPKGRRAAKPEPQQREGDSAPHAPFMRRVRTKISRRRAQGLQRGEAHSAGRVGSATRTRWRLGSACAEAAAKCTSNSWPLATCPPPHAGNGMPSSV